MTAILWANVLLALLFLLAWSGIPLWMVFKHPDTAPDHFEAHVYLAAKAAHAAPGPERDGRSLTAVRSLPRPASPLRPAGASTRQPTA